MVMNQELKLFWKCIKNVRGDQGGCERKIEVIVKMQKKKVGKGGPGPVGGLVWGGVRGLVGGRGFFGSKVGGRGWCGVCGM